MNTKLTIKLHEALKRRVKAVAALRGETISDVVRDALENYIAEAMEEAEDVKAVREMETRIAAGVETISDWEGFESELDAFQD